MGYSWEEKMFGFHKPKMYRSIEGCCICRAKSSSSRFTDSKRYEKDFQNCFGLHEARSGDICNACVLLVKRWKKLPAGSKKNWNHVSNLFLFRPKTSLSGEGRCWQGFGVVDARAGPSLKTTLKPKKMKTLSGSRIKSNQISKLQKEFKRHSNLLSSESFGRVWNEKEELVCKVGCKTEVEKWQGGTRNSDAQEDSDAHSTTSSASPAQSPCYSNQSDDGSDTELSAGASRTPVFSFLDLTYWKSICLPAISSRQKVCCGIIYKGRFGEVLIDTHLFKPCCSNKKSTTEKPEQEGPQSPAISTQEEW
ncbi:Protein FAM60A [Lonchura striata]|uniref:Protein FAM60A n=1 Tax=Lonchura striata TaxID=40157 RepID=A0A218UGA8_9PASE|nr:Protein FAM60A [Lonchura striata domestica]